MSVYKKKTMRLNEMLETGLVEEGQLLRYKVCFQPKSGSLCRSGRVSAVVLSVTCESLVHAFLECFLSCKASNARTLRFPAWPKLAGWTRLALMISYGFLWEFKHTD